MSYEMYVTAMRESQIQFADETRWIGAEPLQR